tara:strand:+ start:13769 stop:14200 length:432 start_codon:yes stop_codon:yes gene_type:complete
MTGERDMKSRLSIGLAAAAALALSAPPALAQDAAARPDSEPHASSAQAQPKELTSAPFASAAVSDDTLQSIAGREDTRQYSQADLKAGVANNSVGDHAVTGAAEIDGNAFQNMSGLSILNVNTGNNVAINAAMNVNISISPGQ